jgi:hypothetical protein
MKPSEHTTAASVGTRHGRRQSIHNCENLLASATDVNSEVA